MRTRMLSAAALCHFVPLPWAAARADDAPEVKTGIRVVATITVLLGIPTVKLPPPVPARGTAVKVCPEGGDKAVVEAKPDDRGVCVVALPAGKYRVEAAPTAGPTGAAPVKVEVKEGQVSEAVFRFVIALP